MQKFITTFLIVISLFISLNTAALTIEGKIIDTDGNPLIAATVMVQELKTGVTTDNEGSFSLPVPNDRELTLVANFIGHEPYIQKIDPKKNKADQLILQMSWVVTS